MRNENVAGTQEPGGRGGAVKGSGRRGMARVAGAVSVVGVLTLALPTAGHATTGEKPSPGGVSAVTYWSFDADMRGCLTGGDSGAAFETACSASNTHQDWYWTGSQHDMLKNRATGKCLATDFKSGSKDKANGVWTSTCNESAKGQHWEWGNVLQEVGVLYSGYGTRLRTSDLPQAVYTDDTDKVHWAHYYWHKGLT